MLPPPTKTNFVLLCPLGGGLSNRCCPPPRGYTPPKFRHVVDFSLHCCFCQCLSWSNTDIFRYYSAPLPPHDFPRACFTTLLSFFTTMTLLPPSTKLAHVIVLHRGAPGEGVPPRQSFDMSLSALYNCLFSMLFDILEMLFDYSSDFFALANHNRCVWLCSPPNSVFARFSPQHFNNTRAWNPPTTIYRVLLSGCAADPGFL